MPLDQDDLNSLRIDRGAPPGRKRPSKLGLAIAAALILAVIFMWTFGTGSALEVETAVAVQTNTGGPAAVLDASGYVVARRQSTVSAKTTGKVAEVLIEEGMSVKEDQLLAKLDDTTVRAQLELAQREADAARKNLAQTEVRLAEAERTLRRRQQLRADNLVAEADLDAAQSEVAALRAQLEALQSQVAVSNAGVRVQQRNLDDLFVRAPFAGVVISKDAQPGEMVSPLSAGGGYTRTGIATIVDMESREIEVDVNESFINRVREGQKTEAVLDAYPDWTIPSHVVSIVPAADRQKATVKVRIGFDQLDPRILPDMGVKVRFLDDTPATGQPAPPAIEVPSSAVTRTADKSYVWRLRGNTVERIAVETGAEREGMIAVTRGLRAGDVVVTQPGESLREGARVKRRAS